MRTNKALLVAALAVTGALGVGVAQARDAELQWSVTIGSPFGAPYVHAPYAPVYVQPAPIYHRPAPVYVQRPVPVYVQPVPVHAWRDYQVPTRWDRDGDGIPNRHDRVYNPRWDRDGDGIPNRHDRNDRNDRGDRGDDRHDRQVWRGR